MTCKEARELIAAMSADDIRSVNEYALQHGRAWKASVREAWDKGTDTGFLRRLRNSVGPSGLEYWVK